MVETLRRRTAALFAMLAVVAGTLFFIAPSAEASSYNWQWSGSKPTQSQCVAMTMGKIANLQANKRKMAIRQVCSPYRWDGSTYYRSVIDYN